MRISPALATASLILVAISTTACSGGSKSATDNPATGSQTTNGSKTTTTTSTSGQGDGSSPSGVAVADKNFDVCTSLTAAQASQITGTKFTKTKSTGVENMVFGCEYSGPDSSLLQISVTPGNGKIAYDADLSTLKTVGFPPNPVSGVGDEAFSAPNPQGNAGSVGASAFASYGALFGDTFIQIGGLTYVTPDQGKAIVEQLNSKL